MLVQTIDLSPLELKLKIISAPLKIAIKYIKRNYKTLEGEEMDGSGFDDLIELNGFVQPLRNINLNASEIVMYLEPKASHDTVIHELFHVVVALVKLNNIEPIVEAEEMPAQYMGYLANMFDYQKFQIRMPKS